MKTIHIYAYALFIAFLLSSCEGLFFDCHEGNGKLGKEKRYDTDFNEVICEGSFNVNIEPGEGNKYSIVVEGDNNLLEYIESMVIDNELHLSLRDDECITPDYGVTVYVKCPGLQRVVLAGSGDITVSNYLETQFKASITGSGDIDINNLITTSILDLRIDGSGDIDASGRAAKAYYTVDGSGNIDAGSTIAKQAFVVIDGSGDAYVNAVDKISVDIYGSGDVYYNQDVRDDSDISELGSGKAIAR